MDECALFFDYVGRIDWDPLNAYYGYLVPQSAGIGKLKPTTLSDVAVEKWFAQSSLNLAATA